MPEPMLITTMKKALIVLAAMHMRVILPVPVEVVPLVTTRFRMRTTRTPFLQEGLSSELPVISFWHPTT